MDTNTMMLIALAVIVVLSAVCIWLANRGSGITSAEEVVDEPETYDEHDTSSTRAAD